MVDSPFRVHYAILQVTGTHYRKEDFYYGEADMYDDCYMLLENGDYEVVPTSACVEREQMSIGGRNTAYRFVAQTEFWTLSFSFVSDGYLDMITEDVDLNVYIHARADPDKPTYLLPAPLASFLSANKHALPRDRKLPSALFLLRYTVSEEDIYDSEPTVQVLGQLPIAEFNYFCASQIRSLIWTSKHK